MTVEFDGDSRIPRVVIPMPRPQKVQHTRIIAVIATIVICVSLFFLYKAVFPSSANREKQEKVIQNIEHWRSLSK